MKEEIRVRPQEYKVYITNDGEEFTNKREAEKHEINLMPEKQIPKFSITLRAIEEYGYCYKIESETDLNYLTCKEWKIAYYDYVGPGWYIAIQRNGGDSEDSYTVFPIDNYIKDLQHDLNALKELESKELEIK